jgi:uncharacterized protein (TIRG00374 family)
LRFLINSPKSSGKGQALGIADVLRRVFSLPTILSVGFGLAIIAFLLWRVLDFEWDEFVDHLTGINWWLFASAGILYYISFWFRGWRWQLIYNAVAQRSEEPEIKGSAAPSVLTMSGLILTGWFVNSVMFFRVGDAYRGWALADRTKSDMPTALGTVFAERVQDMAVVLVLLVVSAVWALIVDGFAASGAIVDVAMIVVAVASVLVLVLFLILYAMRAAGEHLARLVPGRFRKQYLNFQGGALNSFRGGRMPTQIGLGVLGWLMEVARFYFVAQAMGLDMAMSIAMFAALSNAIMTTIPVPGGLGFVETALVTVLLLTGLSHTDAFTLTVLDRAISWLSIVGIGGVVFLGMTLQRNSRSRTTTTAEATADGGWHQA